jgi:hypothetical protein
MVYSVLHIQQPEQDICLSYTSVTVVADLSLVQNVWQKADNIRGKFKQEHTESSVNYIA